MRTDPSKTVSYWSFGFFPLGKRGDIYHRRIGYPNLLKRVQAPAILRELALRNTETCLDVGCGSGYITIELAKLAAKAIGIDTNPSLATIKAPDFLADKLQFITQDARAIPLPDCSVDVVLCSEVLMMIPEPLEFLTEVKRVLKPGGRLVSVSGLGHPAIREGYETHNFMFKLARLVLRNRMPRSYDEYYAHLQKHFGTALQPQEITFYPRLLEENGFAITNITYAPSKLSGSFFSWVQFFQFNLSGKGVTKFTLLRFWIGTLLNAFGREGYRGGQIVSARVADTKEIKP